AVMGAYSLAEVRGALHALIAARTGVKLTRCWFFFFQAEDGIRDYKVTGVQTCALPICDEGEERRPATGRGEPADGIPLRTPHGRVGRGRATSVHVPGAPRDLRPGGLGLPDVVLPAASCRRLPRAGDEGDHDAGLKLGAHLDGKGRRDMRPVDHLEHLRPRSE